MTSIEKSMQLLRQLEFSNDNTKLLHKNKFEDGLTYYGIYQSAHPSWRGWKIINQYLANEPDLKKCSLILANVSDLNKLVLDFYKREFWDKAQLDLVDSQKIADEIFLFGVNVGMRTSIKMAQRLANVLVDGIVGQKTINALNGFNESIFDMKFDELEKKHYDKIIESKPYLSINKKGWYNRADYI